MSMLEALAERLVSVIEDPPEKTPAVPKAPARNLEAELLQGGHRERRAEPRIFDSEGSRTTAAAEQ